MNTALGIEACKIIRGENEEGGRGKEGENGWGKGTKKGGAGSRRKNRMAAAVALLKP